MSPSTNSLRGLAIEDHILSNTTTLLKKDKPQAHKEQKTDDFITRNFHLEVEHKKAAKTANQIHFLKADVFIISKDKNTHVVATGSELYPLCSRQHVDHKIDCASFKHSGPKINKLGGWIPTEQLDEAVSAAERRFLADTDWHAKTAYAKELNNSYEEEKNALFS